MAQTKRSSWEKDQQENKFAFDKVFAQYDHKIAGSTKYEDRTVLKKAKAYTNAKSELQHIVTSSQTVGWRSDIDNLRPGVELKGTCRRTFHDEGHL